jgi:hypothetical protein
MSITLEQFAHECHVLLKKNPNPIGRQQVADLLSTLLTDRQFIDLHINDTVGERKIIYEDSDLGFCILAHNYVGAKTSGAHDHAHSWAIYGQARGETEMRDYALLEPGSFETPGKVKYLRTYSLSPGMAHVYNEGDLHSPKRSGPTSLIRIEGTDMSKVKRFEYQIVEPI